MYRMLYETQFATNTGGAGVPPTDASRV